MMWSAVKRLSIIAIAGLMFGVIGLATSDYLRSGSVLAQQSGPGDGGSPVPTDLIVSSSTTPDTRVTLQLTVGSLPSGIAVGSSVELYLGEDFQVPDAIGVNRVYFVASNPVTRGTGSGARVHVTSASVIRNGSHFGGDYDWSIRVRIPDLCTSQTDECAGPNGLMQGQTLTLVIDQGAGIKNPSEAGSYSVGYSLLGPVDNGNRGPEVRLDNLATYAKISLSDIKNTRGYELTVTGSGFNNGTTAGVYVLHDPSVGPDVFDDSASEAALCERIINQGTLVGSALVGSDDRVSVTFVVTAPTFGPGNANYICMVDVAGRMSHTDVERFHLEHTIRVAPSVAGAGDSVTVFAQDFPNAGVGFTELKVAGRTIAVSRSSSIGADGSATATFAVPSGLVGTVIVEARWGNVSETTRMTVVVATQAPPLVRPYSVRSVSNSAGELTIIWDGGNNADSYVLIAVHMGTFAYQTATVSDGSARMGTVVGLTGGASYLGIVVALKSTADGLEILHGSSTPVTVELTPAAAAAPAMAITQRHIEQKRYMLEFINAERTRAGVSTVILGDNIAAQLHAESSLENCFSSHWGLDGLKPYMRYSLAGGYQSNGENGSGLDYCVKASDGYRAIASIEQEIREVMDGWMSSPGHRRNLLDPEHWKVNIGLAWDRYNTVMVQHFEGDYVEFDRLPAIANGVLSFSGTTKNGAWFADNLGQQIYYDAPPHMLTRGQVARTYCYDRGLTAASLRKPLSSGYFYPSDEFTTTYNPCPDPYDVPPDTPAPGSVSEAHQAWQEAYNASQLRVPQLITVPWITASERTVSGNAFAIKADISPILDQHGPGVYSVVLWGSVGGADAVISEYSIFHGITSPDPYDPGGS